MMNIKSRWIENNDDNYETKADTISQVQSNFDIRRLYSTEGYEISVVIDDIEVEEWVIMQSHSNPLNEKREDMKVHFPLSLQLSRGDYISWTKYGETWMVFSRIDEVDGAYKSAQVQKCNNTVKWLDEYNVSHELGVIFSKFGKNNEGVKDFKEFSVGNKTTYIFIQNNSDTIKFNKKQGNRFIIGRSVYKITDVESGEFDGLLFVILEEDEEIVGIDDMENRIAQNVYDDIPIVVSETGSELIIETDTLYYGYEIDIEAILYTDGVVNEVQPTITYSFDDETYIGYSQTDNILSITGVVVSNDYSTKEIIITAEDGVNTLNKTIEIRKL